MENINLLIKEKSLNALIGTIGSGKSSLLMSILKEIPIHKGEISIKGSISYVEQEPIVFNGVLKDLIVFGYEYDKKKLSEILSATGFLLDIK